MVRSKDGQQSLYFDYREYDFEKPEELQGKSSQHSVVIVGAGPVGLTAALELARHGIKSVLLDDKNTVNEGSRAICIARHSMECLHQLGLAKKFEDKSLPWTHGSSFYRDRLVYRLEMPHSEADKYYPMYNLQQQYIEQLLLDEVIASDMIELRWQSKVCDVEQNENAVSLRVETPAGDYSIRSDYVLAADGARSIVRHQLGLKLEGDAYEGRYVIADIQMKSDFPTERRAFFDPSSNPGLTILIHKQPQNIWRIDYQIEDDVDTDEELKEENIRARIAAVLTMIGETTEWKLEWWSLYKAYTLALDNYRHNRILFIGDAAHLVPIFGVRGLNSGIADAMNAAWKLAYVIQGQAQDALLDTYSPERRGATLDVFENASKSTKFMTPPTRGHRLMRDAVLSLSISNEFSRPLINPRQSQPYTYIDSPLTSYRNRDAEFEHGPGTGAPILNSRINDTDCLLDYIGLGFSGLYFSDSELIDPVVLKIQDKLGVKEEGFTIIIITKHSFSLENIVVVHDRRDELFSSYDAENGSFYLIRPDRHVSARWKNINIDEVVHSFNQTMNGGKSE